MKNKKGMEFETIIVLILAVVIAVFIIGYLKVYTDLTKTEGNKRIVQTWVRQQAFIEKPAGPIEGITQKFTGKQDRPPVPELAEPYVIEKASKLRFEEDKSPEAFDEIAASMIDCWDAFDKGKINFLNTINKNTFCYPCRTIKFSDDIKSEFNSIHGFNTFLNEYKPVSGENNPTYVQILSNDNTYTLEKEDLEEDEISIDKDMYVLFFASSGRTWGNIALNVAGLGDIIEEDLEDKKYSQTSTNSQSPIINTDEDISAARYSTIAGALASGGLASKAYLLKDQYLPGTYPAEKTSQALAELLSKESGTTLSIKAEVEVAESGAREVSFILANDAEKKGAKALSRALSKSFAKQGIKLLASKLNLYATIATAGIGLYKVTFSEKPYVASVVLTDDNGVKKLCSDVEEDLVKQEIEKNKEKIDTSRNLDDIKKAATGRLSRNEQ